MFGPLPRLSPWLYYGLVLLLTAALLLHPSGTAVLMLAPGAAVLLMLLVVTREGWHRAGWASMGLHRSGRQLWLAAAAVPLGIFAIGHFALWSLPTFAVGPTGAAPDDTGLALVGGILATTLVASLTTVLAEEVGWRGYLLPRLLRLGERRALVVSSLLHALWHVPVIVFTDLYHAGGNRWVSVPLFVLVGLCGGVFMGYLRVRSDSVWPAVIAHAVHNAAWTFFGVFTLGSGATLEFVAGERGVVTAVGYLVVAGVILLALVPRRSRAVAPPPSTPVPALAGRPPANG